MKKGFLFLAVVVLAACSTDEPRNDEEVKDDSKQEAVVTFRIDVPDTGDAAGAAARMTRGTAVSESDMTDLWAFDYVGGRQKQGTRQMSTDTNFGTISMTLPLGTHTVYFVASRGLNPNEDTDDLITWETPKDTFWGSVTVNVESGTSANVSVELKRVVTKLAVSITDAVPDDMSALVITPAEWYYGIDYTTGMPIGLQYNAARTISVPSSYVGSTDLSAAIFGFCTNDEWTTGFTVTAQNASGTAIGQASVAQAPFMANRTTRFSGPLFHASGGMSITLDDEWLDEYSATW